MTDTRVSKTPYNVLFICTANSARSILAEAAMNRAGNGRFMAFSAGSKPSGEVHPMALQVLRDLHLDTSFARSKSWDEFSGPDAPNMHFIFTVCDEAAGEECPDLARPSPDRSLGRARPEACCRNRGREGARIRRRLQDAGPPHRCIRGAANRVPRPSCAQVEYRRDRERRLTIAATRSSGSRTWHRCANVFSVQMHALIEWLRQVEAWSRWRPRTPS